MINMLILISLIFEFQKFFKIIKNGKFKNNYYNFTEPGEYKIKINFDIKDSESLDFFKII